MITAKEFWRKKFDEYPQTDSEKLAVAMMVEYASEAVKNISSNLPVLGSLPISEKEQLIREFISKLEALKDALPNRQ